MNVRKRILFISLSAFAFLQGYSQQWNFELKPVTPGITFTQTSTIQQKTALKSAHSSNTVFHAPLNWKADWPTKEKEACLMACKTSMPPSAG